MADNLVIQPSNNPTRKLTAAVIAAAIIEVSRVFLRHFAPDFDDPTLWAALSPLMIYGIGYFVKDEANVLVVTPSPVVKQS